MRPAKKMALTGILCALGVVIMLLGGVIPFSTFCCPVLAGIMLIPVFVECGEKMAYGAYIAMAALSLMLCPDKEAALLLAFIGYYPVLRWRLDQIRSRLLRIMAKLAVFNVSVIAMYALCMYVFRMDQILQEFRTAGMIMTLSTLALGNITLLVYDRVLAVAAMIYVNKMRGKLL